MKLPNRVIEGSADGTISRTCCNPHRLRGAVRQLANVTWPSGKGGKPFIRSGIIRSGLKEVGRSPQNQILRARETIATAGHTKLLFTEIGVFWAAKAVNFSRTY